MLSLSLVLAKSPRNELDLLPDSNKLITFINFYYFIYSSHTNVKYNRFDYIASDGFVLTFLLKYFIGAQTKRISFDMTSVAPQIFNYCIKHNLSLYFIGANENDIYGFIRTITKNFPGINIIGFRNGYFTDKSDLINSAQLIKDKTPNIVIIGMGAPLQDEFSLFLKDLGFAGTIYTCGGFIHQTSNRLKYYPYLINKLNLRFLYRFVFEKYVFKRTIGILPLFIKHLFKNKKKIVVLRRKFRTNKS